MQDIKLRILGPIQPVIDDAEVVLSGRKLRCILALLAIRTGDEVRRDELIEELNLLNSSTNAVNTLHAHMTRLRRWLHGHAGDTSALLESTPSGYRLLLGRSAIDAHRFVQHVEHATKLFPRAPSIVAAILEEALGLWRGDALLDVTDGPLAAAAADELHQTRSAAREMLLDVWATLGHDHRVIMSARRFIADDPLNERLRAQLIIALRHVGRHAEAAEAYRTSRHVLRTELGVPPSEELSAAYSSMLDRLSPLRSGPDTHRGTLSSSIF